MQVERCNSDKCRRPFSVREMGGQMPGTKESEEITCPYCNHTLTRRSNGFFKTNALSPDLEAEFNTKNLI